MYKPDEKDIDRLSREAAEHYHAPGQPSWDALQQILDKELPQEKEKKRRGFFFYFLLLLGLAVAGSGVWYGMRSNGDNKGANKIASATVSENKGIDTDKPLSGSTKTTAGNGQRPENTIPGSADATMPNNPISKNDGAPNDKTVAASLVKSHAANTNEVAGTTPAMMPVTNGNAANISSKEKTSFTVKARKEKIAGSIKDQPTTANRQKKTSTHIPLAGLITDGNYTSRKTGNRKTNPGKTIAKNKTAGNKTGSQTGVAAINNDDEETAAGTKSIVADNTIADTGSMLKNTTAPVNTPDTSVTDKVNAITSSTATIQQKKDTAAKAVSKKSKKEKAITISLLAGMDLSTVKFTHNSSTGYNIGLTAGYQSGRHWAVTTGVIYTKKNYELNGTDYHPSQHYWTQYVKLETVDGYCRMWELPLLARYSFKPGAKTTFFVSTGLSSYFMKKQQYEYSYKNNMNQPMKSAWSNDSSFNHVFSILHFSAGIEKPLGRHMSWQIEPYAKIPLGGVGFGNIRLSSFGINFSVQYRKALKH